VALSFGSVIFYYYICSINIKQYNMSKWHPNSSTHKANHGGYKQRPSKGSVNALLGLYSACNVVAKEMPKPIVKKEIGVQLKINF
jgi:hypothetical protein